MLTAVESIVEGTWGSGAPPQEFIDFFLMAEMHWSWHDLEETPPYVRRYCYDFRQAILLHEADEMDKANAKAEASAHQQR